MKRFIYQLLLSTIIGCALGCSNNKSTQTDNNLKDGVQKADTSLLSDENFPYHNLQSTEPLMHDHKFVEEKLFADSTHKVSFKELTENQKLKLIVPFLTKNLGIKKSDHIAIEKLMMTYFIAKQDKIGDLQPIILFLNGDDYSALTMIVLDKNGKPIDGFNLAGGLENGPTGESPMIYNGHSFSTLTQGQIISSRIEISEFPDSLNKPLTIDSSIFRSVIDKSGKIITKQLTRSKYLRPK